MGNSSTTPVPTQEQADVKFLGDRCPFGDQELHHLYKAYLRFINTNNTNPDTITNFLCDWASQCGGEEEHPEIAKCIGQIQEHDIVPVELGNALFRACFSIPYSTQTAATSQTSLSNSSATAPSPVIFDEYTRKARLEQFFEGLSNCSSRRGTKAVMTALFDTQYELIHQFSDDDSNNHSSDDSNHDTTADGKQQQQQQRRVSARALVETGYRLALATAYIQKKHHDENKHDEAVVDIELYVPTIRKDDDDDESNSNSKKKNGDDTMEDDHQLAAFAQSIVEKGRKRRQRSGMPGCQSTECPHLAQSQVELEDVLEWADTVAPMFASILPTLFHYILFPATPFPGSRTAFVWPQLLGQDDDNDNTSSSISSSFFTSVTTSPRLFVLACLSPSLTGRYHCLYNSAADGLSFNRLQNAVLGYGGPTVLLIQSTNGGAFGAFTASAWKESKDFYGNTDCFLYQLAAPCTAVYRPKGGSARNFMYCNSTARSRGYDQQAHGIGFGGDVHEPRLFIAENLDDCVAASQDLTFDNGNLLPQQQQQQTSDGQQHRNKYFNIHCLEVWGVGGTETVASALQARGEARALADEAIRRARKVDKAQFLDDFRTGTFGSKAFKHRQEADGRANTDMDERCQDKDKVYEYAK